MNNKIKIAVLGGGGKTGKYLVNQLLEEGYHLKLLLRNPSDFHIQNPLVEIIHGDAIDPIAINALTQDCKAIINTVGQRKDEPLVSSGATRNILNAMSKFGINRYILLAGLNIDTPFDKKSQNNLMATEWMKSNFSLIHNDRQLTYSILSESNVNWTLVRVPIIEFSELKGEIIVSKEDCQGKMIYAKDLADFLIEQLTDLNYLKKAPFISNI